jgi:hypothetical protein
MPIFGKVVIASDGIFSLSKGAGGALYEDPNKQIQSINGSASNNLALNLRQKSVNMARLRGSHSRLNMYVKPLFGDRRGSSGLEVIKCRLNQA